jgi:hypothetical protein
MFKYLSNILEKFSMAQRITVLTMLLFSTIIVTLGPTLIDSLTQDTEELRGIIETQSSELRILRKDVDTLNIVIRNNQRECTDQIIEREKEIMALIDELEDRIRRTNNRQENQMVIPNDSVSNPRVIRIIPNDNTMMIEGLKVIKQNLKVDMDKRKGN